MLIRDVKHKKSEMSKVLITPRCRALIDMLVQLLLLARRSSERWAIDQCGKSRPLAAHLREHADRRGRE
jgi:hypothetical protein